MQKTIEVVGTIDFSSDIRINLFPHQKIFCTRILGEQNSPYPNTTHWPRIMIWSFAYLRTHSFQIINAFNIVLYDEQHPKKGRTQKFRLTLLDSVTGQPIAEELHDSKNSATITAFLTKYLDPSKRTFVVYFVKGAPATNNGVENYYSTSLKTHRKKQLRSDRWIEIQMKLSAMKRAGLLGRCKKTLLEAFLMFVPFLMFWYSFG